MEFPIYLTGAETKSNSVIYSFRLNTQCTPVSSE